MRIFSELQSVRCARVSWLWGIACVLVMALAGPSYAGSGPRNVLLVYSGNTLGELKPCGCAREEDQGGIERRMTYLTEVRSRAGEILLLDTGDNFKEPSVQGKLKAQTLMKSLAAMKYDGIAVGEHDLVYGNRFLQDHAELPWLSGNLKFQGLVFPEVRIKKFNNGIKTAVLTVAEPELFYAGGHADIQIDDPKNQATRLIAGLHRSEKPDLVVLITHMHRKKALEYLALQGVDVVINGHIQGETDTIDMSVVERAGKIFVQPGPRGQKMGEIEVRIGSGGEKTFEQRMVRLDSSVKFDSEMVKLYEQYNEKVEELFFASLSEKRADNKKNVFATDAVCKTCHPSQHQVWSESRHGHAYATLRKVHKAFDPECLVCHVTGLDQPGGFISEVDTPELENVQCEVCHGPGAEHAKAPGPGFGGNAAGACAKCHVKNHSPNFDYSKYWPKIRH